MKVTIDIDDKYAGLLSVTAVSNKLINEQLYCCNYLVNLDDGAELKIDENGRGHQRKEGGVWID